MIPDDSASEPRHLVRRAGRVYIDGLQEMDWGGSFFARQDSFMACMVAILRCSGRDVHYHDVLGLSAQAFKLTLNRDWHPAVAHGHVGIGAYDAEGVPLTFPGDGSPMNHHAAAMRAFGISWSHIPLDAGENPSWRADLFAALRPSIDAGIPIYYMNGEWNLIVGYAEDESVFICKPYAGSDPGYEDLERPGGFVGDCWWANVASPENEPVPHPQATIDALRAVVINARRGSVPVGDQDIPSGFTAYENWIGGLERPWESISLHGNAFNYAQLLTSREAAGRFLEAVAGQFHGDAPGRLRAAAEAYNRTAARLLEEHACVAAPWQENWTEENRAREAAALRISLSDEREAISEIEAALNAIGEQVPSVP